MKDVGVVICNYNKQEYVVRCIQSVLESKYQDFDLYVVDNASTDNSIECIQQMYGDRLTLIQNAENLGGSGGFNTGLRVALEKEYTYLMCVDDDALLDENVIGNLRDFLMQHPEVGIAGAKIYHREAPDYIQQFGQKIDFQHFCTEALALNQPEDGSMPEFVYCDAVAACALMIRTEVVQRIGVMPEENFLYWDDTEWCYLCTRAGYKVASVGNAKALHAMGAKKEAENTFPTYYAWRNWIRFFAKYVPEENWERMAQNFLELIFEIAYEGLHKNEENKIKTIMLAYDDALHNITGRAGKNRIFPLDFNETPWRKLFSMENSFYLREDKHPSQAEYIKDLAKRLGYDIVWKESPGTAREIVLCDSIFSIEDLSLEKVYIDIDDCILASEDDMLNVINYNYSKRCFVFTQKPLFLQRLEELRSGKED